MSRQDGGTALIVAAQCGHMDVVQELLRRGADPHAAMKDRATAIFVASQNGHTSVVRTLLAAGAKVCITPHTHSCVLYIHITNTVKRSLSYHMCPLQ